MKNIIVIKIGSSVLMTKRNKLDEFRVAHIANQIVDLKSKSINIVLVISGAVAYGANFINLTKAETQQKQAAAGIGQIYITSLFNRIFTSFNLQLAQILLTKDSLASKGQKKKIRNLINFYLEANFIPFLNENDVLELNSFGGNDLLAAWLAEIMRAQLVILSTWEKNRFGVGGGATKLEAVERLKRIGIPASIRNGKKHNCLLKGELI